MYESIQHAVEARIDITERILTIDNQLAERKAAVAVGKIQDKEYKAYLVWKAKACRAKQLLVVKLHKTKVWIKQQRELEYSQRLAGRNDSVKLLGELYGVTKSLAAAYGISTVSPQQIEWQRVLDDVEQYLRQH